jgi:hypothetical protein
METWHGEDARATRSIEEMRMKRMAWAVFGAWVAAGLAAGVGGAGPRGAVADFGELNRAEAPAGAAASQPAKVIKLKNLSVDLGARTVTMDAEVNLRTGMLEFLLCGDTRPQSKKHESILSTKATASELHAALLLLGLAPGKPAQWSGEGPGAVFLPPRGARLKIAFRWKDKDGKAQQADAADWLTTPQREDAADRPEVPLPPQEPEMRLIWRWSDKDGKPQEVDSGAWRRDPQAHKEPNPLAGIPQKGAELKLTYLWKDAQGQARQTPVGPLLAGRTVVMPRHWVFVGSETLKDGQYWADQMGELISVSNFASSVIDVPFESSSNNTTLDYVANTQVIPDKGTPVEVILTPLAGADKAEDAREVLDIDRFGRMQIDGKPITLGQLGEWAGAFMSRHPRGMVVLRADGMTLVDDIEKARDELRLGGVREFQEQHLPVTGCVLPRTSQQAGDALEEWRKKFANPKDYIREPAEEAAETLKMVRQELAELDRMKALGVEYELHLRQAMEKYKASTRPAGKGASPAGAGSVPPGRPQGQGKD